MNAFERLELPAKLDLEPGLIEDRVQGASRASHPDIGGNEVDFQEIRRAGEIVAIPALRIRAALEIAGVAELERGRVPGEVMDLFAPVASILEEVSAFVSGRAKALSGLGKAVLDVKVPGLKRELEDLTARLMGLEEKLVLRFPEFDERGWRECLEEMAETARGLVFLRKWLGQLREANGKIFEALLGG